MLLSFFQWLGEDIRAFQVFNYLSLRAVMAALTALVIGFVAGPAMIRYLRAMKVGQAVRTNGPKTHLVKDALGQRRHADDGRCFDFDCDWFVDAFVDGLEQSIRLGRLVRDFGLRLDRLGR